MALPDPEGGGSHQDPQRILTVGEALGDGGAGVGVSAALPLDVPFLHCLDEAVVALMGHTWGEKDTVSESGTPGTNCACRGTAAPQHPCLGCKHSGKSLGIRENKDEGTLQVWKSATSTGPGHAIPGSSGSRSRAFGKGRKHWDAFGELVFSPLESWCSALRAAPQPLVPSPHPEEQRPFPQGTSEDK